MEVVSTGPFSCTGSGNSWNIRRILMAGQMEFNNSIDIWVWFLYNI